MQLNLLAQTAASAAQSLRTAALHGQVLYASESCETERGMVVQSAHHLLLVFFGVLTVQQLHLPEYRRLAGLSRPQQQQPNFFLRTANHIAGFASSSETRAAAVLRTSM
jgi:hypothetical protein